MQFTWISAFVVFALTLQVNAGEKGRKKLRAQSNDGIVEALVANPCTSTTCQHGGTCRQVGTSSSYTCSCLSTWTGTNCQNRNPCGSSPCQNGGTCTNRGDNYTCSCTNSWTGMNCQTQNPCGSGPCQNGATCLPGNSTTPFTCLCADGWVGDQCITADPCVSYPCLNGGQCQLLDDGSGYTCSCLDGFHGSTCDLPGNAVFQCQVTAVSYGTASNCPVGYVDLNGNRVWSASSCPGSSSLDNLPGINTILVNPIDCTASYIRSFDTSSSGSDTNAIWLDTYIDYVADGLVLVGVSGGGPTAHWTPALPILLAAGVQVSDLSSNDGNFAFVIQKGYPEKTAYLESTDPTTQLTVSITGTTKQNLQIVN